MSLERFVSTMASFWLTPLVACYTIVWQIHPTSDENLALEYNTSFFSYICIIYLNKRHKGSLLPLYLSMIGRKLSELAPSWSPQRMVDTHLHFSSSYDLASRSSYSSYRVVLCKVLIKISTLRPSWQLCSLSYEVTYFVNLSLAGMFMCRHLCRLSDVLSSFFDTY